MNPFVNDSTENHKPINVTVGCDTAGKQAGTTLETDTRMVAHIAQHCINPIFQKRSHETAIRHQNDLVFTKYIPLISLPNKCRNRGTASIKTTSESNLVTRASSAMELVRLPRSNGDERMHPYILCRGVSSYQNNNTYF